MALLLSVEIEAKDRDSMILPGDKEDFVINRFQNEAFGMFVLLGNTLVIM